MLYGHSNKIVNNGGLHDLSEITIVANPELLRNLAAFILQAADMLEQGGTDHHHASSYVYNWGKNMRGRDIIISLK